MNNKIENPLLKQLISNIANKANEGRMTDINWKSLSEVKSSKKALNENYDWMNDPVKAREFEKSDVSAAEYDEYLNRKKGYRGYQSQYSPRRKMSFKGITFFDVPSGKESAATQVGLTQMKSGKWGFKHRFSPQDVSVASDAEKNVVSAAEKIFGKGRYWEPKNQVNEAKKEQQDDLSAILGGDNEAPETPAAEKTAPDAEGATEKDTGADKSAEEPVAPAAPEADTGEDAEKAQADAVKAKAELEKAKAEKDKAEKEIKKQSYVKLSSGAGTQFLLGKILDHAFKTNTIDALASEMVQKLKIQTPEDMVSFSEDTAQYRVIPGMPELLSSMKTMATKQPEVADNETP